MTIKTLLIKAVAVISFQIMVTQAHAQSDTSARVIYFNNLFKGSSFSCTLSESNKVFLVGRLETAGCATKNVANGQPFFVTASSCGESGAKSKIGPEISSICARSGVAQRAQLQADQAAAQQRAQSATGAKATGLASTAAALKGSYDLYKKHSGDIDKLNKGLDKYVFKKDDKDKKAETASVGSKDSGNPQSASQPGSGAVGAANQVANVINTTPVQTSPATPPPPQAPEGAPATTGSVTAETVEGLNADESKALGELKGNYEKTKPEVKAAAENAPSETKSTAKDIASEKGASATDKVAQERLAKSAKMDQELFTEIDTYWKSVKESAVSAVEAINTCAETDTNGTYAAQMPNDEKHLSDINKKLIELETLSSKFAESKVSCSKAAVFADNFCNVVRNPTAQKVQYMTTIAAGAISKASSASEVCKTTSNVSKVAQGGMLLAQLTCTTFKFKCDISCKMFAKSELEKMKNAVQEIFNTANYLSNSTCAGLPPAVAQMSNPSAKMLSKLNAELAPTAPLPEMIAQCQKHAADIGLMAAQVLGLASAAKDAKDCEKKLAAGGSSGLSAGSNNMIITTAELCSKPENAESSTCKCTFNPNAEGCLGAASQGLGGIKTNNGGAGSGLAGFGNGANGTEATPPPVSVGGGLSEEAKNILNAEKAAADGSGSSFGGGSGAAGSGLSGSFGARSSRLDDSDKKSKDSAETKKSRFNFSLSGISSGLSSLFGGKKSNSGSGSGASFDKEKQEAAIKRKLASDQARAEVSTASGKSNFDKVKNRYQVTGASLLQGQ